MICSLAGKKVEEAVLIMSAKVMEAIALCLEVRAEKGLPLTIETDS